MNKFLKRHLLTIIGIPVGGIGGYIYYYFWGCTNGCPIKSNAETMVIYGSIMGGLLFNFIQDLISRSKSNGSDCKE